MLYPSVIRVETTLLVGSTLRIESHYKGELRFKGKLQSKCSNNSLGRLYTKGRINSRVESHCNIFTLKVGFTL